MCASDKVDGDVPPYCPQVVKAPFLKNPKFLQLYRLKQKHNIKHSQAQKVAYNMDWLALSTTWLRNILEALPELKGSWIARNIPSSKKLANITTVTLLSIIFGVLLNKINSEPTTITERNKAWSLVYLTTFAMHFGTQIWMVMISGLVLYFALPRHVFGNVQEHLFPAFFTHSFITSFLMVISFINIQHEITTRSKVFVQIMCMVLTFSIELFIRFHVVPSIVILKHTKTQMESEAGNGQEVGRQILGELEYCPHYMKILKRFRKLHSYTAIGTFVTIFCGIYHINYLAEKLCL